MRKTTRGQTDLARTKGISKHNIVHRLQGRSLLIAINCLASLSIFFFGYDQGYASFVALFLLLIVLLKLTIVIFRMMVWFLPPRLASWGFMYSLDHV